MLFDMGSLCGKGGNVPSIDHHHDQSTYHRRVSHFLRIADADWTNVGFQAAGRAVNDGTRADLRTQSRGTLHFPLRYGLRAGIIQSSDSQRAMIERTRRLRLNANSVPPLIVAGLLAYMFG